MKAIALAVALIGAAVVPAWGQGAVHHNTNTTINNQGGDTKNVNKSKSSSSSSSSSTTKSVNDNRSSGTGTGTSTVTVEGDREQLAPAYAPGLVAAPETCMGSVAGGGSFLPFGLSFGTTYKSSDCELRMFARALQGMGQFKAAILLLATNEDVARALIDAGYELPEGRRPAVKRVVASQPPAKADGQ